MQYAEFFRKATGDREPFPFQERFATADSLPHLLRAPTGAGKTATAILGWLWRLRYSGKPTPRRLVYCLPMRVLVEQSYQETLAWLYRLGWLNAPVGFNPDNQGKKKDKDEKYLPLRGNPSSKCIDVHQLMGGADIADWHLHPERCAIFIGTQDMLLSRALNRGYAESRFHWPIDFGLLNSDCLWVLDEPQLMANGVATSAQLAGLRASLDTFGSCPSVWMSATLEPSWLDTVDFRDKFTTPSLELSDADYDPARPLHKKMTADKTLQRLDVASSNDMKDVARVVWDKHESGTQTLVVVNTVDRAKGLYKALSNLRKNAADPKPLLVHSRFRPAERESLNEQLRDNGEATHDRIIVATQVVEAGVDISSRTLITELAPWASIVQRIGRCNRTGDDGPGHVYWIELSERQAKPYEVADLTFARNHLHRLDGQSVSPQALDEYKKKNETPGEPFLPFTHTHVLRNRDLLDLFDTSPDLSGNDIDISRFVRSDDTDTDVQIFWRDIPATGPSEDEPAPFRRELCSVPVGQARDFVKSLTGKTNGRAYIWDHLDGKWDKLESQQVRPGIQILLPISVGGYSTQSGWNPGESNPVMPVPPDPDEKRSPEETGSDPNSATPAVLTIAQHTDNVCRELDDILKSLPIVSTEWADRLRCAARWHDVGKGHDSFQNEMRRVNPDLTEGHLWAKSGKNCRLRYKPKYFRHELVSALASLQNEIEFATAYLIGAHHGRVRLSIRALPGEDLPEDHKMLFALGVRHKDSLCAVDLGHDVSCPATVLDMSPMQLGGEVSWTGRALALLGELGPFRLAYLEAILRAADMRASVKEANRADY